MAHQQNRSSGENLALTITLTKTNVRVQDVSKVPELPPRRPHFRYSRRIHLGFTISKNLSLDPEIARRIGKATGTKSNLTKKARDNKYLTWNTKNAQLPLTLSHQFDVLRDGTRIARLDKKKNLYRKRPEDMSEAQATFDVDFHGESGIACEQALLLGRAKRVSRERASERRSREEPNRRACSPAKSGRADES